MGQFPLFFRRKAEQKNLIFGTFSEFVRLIYDAQMDMDLRKIKLAIFHRPSASIASAHSRLPLFFRRKAGQKNLTFMIFAFC